GAPADRTRPSRGPARLGPGRRRLPGARGRGGAPALPRPGRRAAGRGGDRAARRAPLRAAPAEAHMTRPLLELAGVRYRHGGGGREAVGGVSLRVDPGEVVCLIGPNAAGKSTLARIADGLLRPSEGSVRLRGDDAFALPRRER